MSIFFQSVLACIDVHQGSLPGEECRGWLGPKVMEELKVKQGEFKFEKGYSNVKHRTNMMFVLCLTEQTVCNSLFCA